MFRGQHVEGSAYKDGDTDGDDDGVVLSGNLGGFVDGGFVLDGEHLSKMLRHCAAGAILLRRRAAGCRKMTGGWAHRTSYVATSPVATLVTATLTR